MTMEQISTLKEKLTKDALHRILAIVEANVRAHITSVTTSTIQEIKTNIKTDIKNAFQTNSEIIPTDAKLEQILFNQQLIINRLDK